MKKRTFKGLEAAGKISALVIGEYDRVDDVYGDGWDMETMETDIETGEIFPVVFNQVTEQWGYIVQIID